MKKLKKNKYFIEKLKNDVIRQIRNYLKYDNHETDFNHEDVRALSDGLFDACDNLIKMRYSNLYKTIIKNKPIEIEHYNSLSYRVADVMYFDKCFRQIANELSYMALTMWLWSESECKQDFMTQLTNHIRSFI